MHRIYSVGRVPFGRRPHFSRAAQHLVDFARVHLFDMDHLTGELLEGDGTVLDEREQFATKPQREVLCLQRLAEDRRDIECVRVEEGATSAPAILATTKR